MEYVVGLGLSESITENFITIEYSVAEILKVEVRKSKTLATTFFFANE